MTIGDPTIFPIRHDWSQPFKVTREGKTDIQTAADGTEVRSALRSAPHITCTMRGQFLSEMGAGRLLAAWRGAAQPLRFYAPLWCDATDLTSAVVAGDAIVECDTTDRPFFAIDGATDLGYAMLFSENRDGVVSAEVVGFNMIDDGLLGLTAGTTNSYAVTGTRLVPCRVMWLTMPQQVAWQNGKIATCDIQFVEEVPQAAYQLSESTGTFTPASVAIAALNSLLSIATGMAKIATFKAIVLDADGIPGPASVVWSTSGVDITATPSFDTLTARVQKSSTFGAGGSVTATVGALSDTLSL